MWQKDNAASVNAGAMQVCPQPNIKKTQAEWTARLLSPKRPMKNSSENEKLKLDWNFFRWNQHKNI